MTRADWGEPEYELHQAVGEAGSLIYPDDVAFFTDEERDQWRDEIRERQARRKPCGFTAWRSTDEQEQPAHLRVVS